MQGPRVRFLVVGPGIEFINNSTYYRLCCLQITISSANTQWRLHMATFRKQSSDAVIAQWSRLELFNKRGIQKGSSH